MRSASSCFFAFSSAMIRGSWALTTWSLATRPSYATWTSAIFVASPSIWPRTATRSALTSLRAFFVSAMSDLRPACRSRSFATWACWSAAAFSAALRWARASWRSSPRTDGAAGAAKMPAMRGIRRMSSRKRAVGRRRLGCSHPGAYVRISEASARCERSPFGGSREDATPDADLLAGTSAVLGGALPRTTPALPGMLHPLAKRPNGTKVPCPGDAYRRTHSAADSAERALSRAEDRPQGPDDEERAIRDVRVKGYPSDHEQADDDEPGEQDPGDEPDDIALDPG